MARHLYIAGVDRWPDLERGTLRIEQALTYQIDTCTFNVKGTRPSEGSEVIIEDTVVGRVFAGIVVKAQRVRNFPDKSIVVWEVICDDYTALLDRLLVVENYENQSASDIFLDIAAKYCPGFTTNGVRPGAPIVEATGTEFNYTHPSVCFTWLYEYVGWHWGVDYYKDLHFFDLEDLISPAPMELTPGGRFKFGKHVIDTQGLRNRVYVQGGAMLSDPQVLQWKADGVARYWTLPWGPHEVSLAVGEAPMTVGVENLHDEAEYDYMMNFNEKYIRCSNQTTTPVEGTTISLIAKQDIPVITMVEDYVSQAAIAAIQCGVGGVYENMEPLEPGVYEHVITDDSLTTVQAAEAAGMADLKEHANPKVSGSFETEVPGWKPGQIVNINLPDRGVVGEFLIQRVTIFPMLNNPSIWTFQVEYGGRLFGIADFLKALVSAQQKKRNIEPSKSIQKYVYGQETLGFMDELTTITKELPYIVEESINKRVLLTSENEFMSAPITAVGSMLRITLLGWESWPDVEIYDEVEDEWYPVDLLRAIPAPEVILLRADKACALDIYNYKLAFVETDVVCGMVVVDKGKIIIGWQEEIAETNYRYDDPLSTQDFIAQDFIATAAMTGITLLRAFVRGRWLIDTRWGIFRFTNGKPGMLISEPVVLPANEEYWAYVEINLLEPLQEGVSYCLVGQGYPAIGQSGSAFWDYASPASYSGGCQHTSDNSGVSWDSWTGICCTFKIAIPIYG